MPLCPSSESVRNTPSSEPLPPATASSQASCPSEILADPEGSYHGSSTTEEEPSYSSNLPPLRSAHPHAHAHPLKSFAVPAIPATSHPSFESPALPSTPLLAQTGKQQHARVRGDQKTANCHPSCSDCEGAKSRNLKQNGWRMNCVIIIH